MTLLKSFALSLKLMIPPNQPQPGPPKMSIPCDFSDGASASWEGSIPTATSTLPERTASSSEVKPV